MRRFGLLMLFLGGLAPTLAAQDSKPDTQVGNFLFHMPTGWNPVEKNDMTFIYAPSPPPGTLTYIALAADDLEGNLQNSFNVLWTGFKNSYRILQGGQATSTHSRNGYDEFYTSATAMDQHGTKWSVYVMGAQYGKRVQTVMFMSNVPPGTMLSGYQNVFQSFLASLSFGDALPGSKIPAANATADAAAPMDDTPRNLPPGALDGIYVGFGLATGGRMEMKELLFSPDGWVVKNIPPEGMIGFDFTANRNNPNTNRSWVGRYRVDGDKINILWQDYTEHRD